MNPVIQFTQSFLLGFSQIMLQSNSLTGVLFLVGIGLNSVPMLLCAVGGSLIAYLGAVLCGADKQHLKQGLYGYNGALAGLACSVLWPLTTKLLILLSLAALLSAFMMKLYLERRRYPAYTAPFILAVWILVAGIGSDPQPAEWATHSLADMFLLGFGQILFQDSPISGLLFMVGLAIGSCRALCWGAVAIPLSAAFAAMLGYAPEPILQGLHSYNAVLVALALSAAGGVRAPVVIAAILASVLVGGLLQRMGVPVLTAPFVIVTWLVLLLQGRIDKVPAARLRQGEVIPP